MRLTAWLFLLLQAVALTGAYQQQVLDINGAPRSSHDGSRAPEPGSHLVESAMSELRKIHLPHHRRAKRPHGILATVLHYAWMAIPKLTLSSPPRDDSQPTLSGPLRNAVGLLQEAALQNNSDATFLLAEMNFYGNYTHPHQFNVAFDYYQRLASNTGNETALFMLGLMYSTGVGGSVERDQAKALLYYTFAADRGHTQAEMALGFRHYSGIGTPKNCELANMYYKRVADKAMEWYHSGPPGGMWLIQQTSRLADEDGGVYGRGASVISSGHNALNPGLNSDAYSSIEDIIEYLDLMSQKGDVKASFNLGRLYYEGQRDLDRNMELSKKYFLMVARKYWKKNGQVVDGSKQGIDRYAGKAAGFLGRMYLRGEGVQQSFEKAHSWFERGVQHGDAQSLWGRGYMCLNGFHVKQNIGLATDFFKSAIEQDYAPAHVELGTLYLDQGKPEDLRIASHYFELAVRYGNIEASYYLAEMSHQGIGREKQCQLALSYYKNVAERAEPLVSAWLDANEAYEGGEYELAFLEYLLAAEQGYEKAQNNVAFMLDQTQTSLPLTWLIGHGTPPSRLLDDPSLALIYWTRSSRQSNIDSLVKMGDYYLNGIGAEPDADKAAQCYMGASEYHMSAQALYNVGWMHENGIGQTQDFHLAKRYYDFAIETNQESYLPVMLSLFKLRARSAWNTFTHGRINSIQDEPSTKKDWSLSEWIANFLREDDYYMDDEYYDDIYDESMVGEELDELDGAHYLDSLVIVMLAAALVMLFYYRRARQQEEIERRAREQGQQVLGQGPGQAQQQLAQAAAARGRADARAVNQDDFLWPAGGVGL
ncbi:putative ubiquitin-protein ligase sel1 ubx2 protein [Zalerion maritima]|uniref:Ubiquitin-protein ligase sel1 ubx2 protein n=1 Tax=Zalerion maritima TaxID=339359 RepID=A0AAD5RXX1_9PEZI|nr:putative ubiquitin-protein ligase sel1 ubx2 protein [Zalerion maritima]